MVSTDRPTTPRPPTSRLSPAWIRTSLFRRTTLISTTAAPFLLILSQVECRHSGLAMCLMAIHAEARWMRLDATHFEGLHRPCSLSTDCVVFFPCVYKLCARQPESLLEFLFVSLLCPPSRHNVEYTRHSPLRKKQPTCPVFLSTKVLPHLGY